MADEALRQDNPLAVVDVPVARRTRMADEALRLIEIIHLLHATEARRTRMADEALRHFTRLSWRRISKRAGHEWPTRHCDCDRVECSRSQAPSRAGHEWPTRHCD